VAHKQGALLARSIGEKLLGVGDAYGGQGGLPWRNDGAKVSLSNYQVRFAKMTECPPVTSLAAVLSLKKRVSAYIMCLPGASTFVNASDIILNLSYYNYPQCPH
jgi:hypothetical protein